MGAGCTSENNVIRASTTSLRDDDTIPFKILIVGPKNAGKTYLLYSWVIGTDGVHTTKPTEEFNVETVKSKSGTSFTMWDLTGDPNYRHHRKRKFFEGTQGLVFVFNASIDLKIAKDELKLYLQERVLLDIPIVIVANQIGDEEYQQDESLLHEMDIKSDLLNRTWCLSQVRLKSQTDIDGTLCDLQRLMSV